MAKILIVEDHVDTAQVFATLLRRAGHAVEVAGGYQDALQAAKTATPDVMICDIGLPDGDGCDLLRELHEQYNIASIAVSGFITAADRQRYLSAGFSECLAKPCNFQDLEAAVVRAKLFSTPKASASPTSRRVQDSPA